MPIIPSKETTTPINGQDTTTKSLTSTPLNTPAQPKTYHEESVTEEEPINSSNEHVLGSSDLEPPFSQYEEVKNTKYTVDFFDIPDVFKMLDNKFDKYSIKENILKLEEFVTSEIQRMGMDDSLNSYKEIIELTLSEIGKGQNELPHITIWRIGNYIEYLTKYRAAEKLKPMFQHGN